MSDHGLDLGYSQRICSKKLITSLWKDRHLMRRGERPWGCWLQIWWWMASARKSWITSASSPNSASFSLTSTSPCLTGTCVCERENFFYPTTTTKKKKEKKKKDLICLPSCPAPGAHSHAYCYLPWWKSRVTWPPRAPDSHGCLVLAISDQLTISCRLKSLWVHVQKTSTVASIRLQGRRGSCD